MIVKKVPSSKTKNKASSISDLVDYVTDSDGEGKGGKVLYSGARGFLCDTYSARREEMVALAAESVRSKNPISHYILSWQEGEYPSAEHVEEAVTIFLDELGLRDHQVIYALHRDTHNIHLHIVVNRVHPVTHKIIEINRGFDIEAAHRAIARIEYAQGWKREPNARYQVLEDGTLARAHDEKSRRKKVSDFEHRTGEKSALSIAIEEARPIIERAQSWEQLHRELAARGMRYERKGSGAVIFVGDVAVKASDVDRNASLAQFQKRLGPYQPPPQAESQQQAQQQAEPREPEPVKEDMPPEWREYIGARKAHYAEKRASRLDLDARHWQEWQQLVERHRTRRRELLQGNWRGRGAQLNAMRSVIAAEQAAEKAALKEKHKRERDNLRKRFPPFFDFEQWLRMRARDDLAEQWRYRASIDDTPRIEGEGDSEPRARDIRDYVHEIVDGYVFYYAAGGGGGGGVSFVDKGKSIDIHDWRNRDSVLAALQLSAAKWGRFEVIGNDEYKALCAKLAAEYGFKIVNPELQEAIERERARIQHEKAEAMKAEQLKQFELYANAVNADRYRVTCIKMREDGSKQTFILDKRDGVTRGFTPEEIEQRMAEMIRLQRRGENIYYTPLSDDKHHILIDDMNLEKLKRLISDGYKPAVVIESSPGNYQAIITIPKLGTAHDKDVGNRLSSILNQRYGDPKLSGCIHPHRAPGFENRKPKHRKEDGTYPQVRLLKSERRVCDKTLELAREIDAEFQRGAIAYQQHARDQAAIRRQQIEQHMQQLKRDLMEAATEALSSDSAMTEEQRRAIIAYKAHAGHVPDLLWWIHSSGNGDLPTYEDKKFSSYEKFLANMDMSRIDSMIAVRMRVTSHDQSDIEYAIRQCTLMNRLKYKKLSGYHDWDDYARRTARYAFSLKADKYIKDNKIYEKYADEWMGIELKEMENIQAMEQGEVEREQEQEEERESMKE